MSDEIKEILEFDFQSQGERIEINEYERDILKDCITNLQEENKKLKEELQQEKKDFKETNDYCFELKDYKSRNEKAIEYTEKRKNLNWYADGVFVYELLNILQGSDKDE